MVINLLVAFHAFTMYLQTSTLVDEMMLPSYDD